MNKRAVIKKIIAKLEGDVALYAKAARSARSEATDEQSKAENKYDTRGLEASYLARGQSRQAAETARALEQFQKLSVRTFGAGDPVDVGALVELSFGRERAFYFIGPCAGGTDVEHDKQEITVLTPESPLGSQLAGKRAGDRFRIELPGRRDEYHIVTVS